MYKKIRKNDYLKELTVDPREASHNVREVGQLRQGKMHTSCFMDGLSNKKALTPALRGLLEASLILRTTSTKILAFHLHRSPVTIRNEFRQILTIIGD